MSSADRIFEEYAAAYRSGKGDPRPYLDLVPEDERDELMEMIDLFLLKVEPAEWDPDSFRGSEAERITEVLVDRLLVPESGWREMLPGLRMKLSLKREQVVGELAMALKAGRPEEIEKVGDYYHDMEQGNLRPDGVSRRVLESLAGIYGTTVEALKRAGSATVPNDDADGAVFARTFGDADQDFGMASPGHGFSRIKGKPDRIDRLFTEPGYEG